MKIKFSYQYKKLCLHCCYGELAKTAVLLDVLPVNLENLSEFFLNYDTDYGKFKLPGKGEYLMLIFKKTDNDIFTTLRRNTPAHNGMPAKREYYASHIGETFDVVIE